MSTHQLVICIGKELKRDFFNTVADRFQIEYDELCALWDSFCSINSDTTPLGKTRTQKIRQPVISASKATIKAKPELVERHRQTPIDYTKLNTNWKVEDLRPYLRERGLSCGGKKIDLIHSLAQYEQTHPPIVDEDEDVEEEVVHKEKKYVQDGAHHVIEVKEEAVHKEKRREDREQSSKSKHSSNLKKKVAIPVQPTFNVVRKGVYNIVEGTDLVFSEETSKVCGYIDEQDTIYTLDKEHIEQCASLNIEYQMPEDF